MLLGRRTAEKGAWNLTWLVLSALSFSVVGIWSMHFVSPLACSYFLPNRPDRLKHFFIKLKLPPPPLSQVSMLGLRLLPSSSTTWYIRFSAGFTALSLFVPLICCCLAFIFLGSQAELVVWRICLTGCFVGCTISLMHYSALFHLATFDVHYKGYVVFLATLEACIAASLALLLFFKYRALCESLRCSLFRSYVSWG
jgi:NO-binding membrane sensor protein with MHYT domain